MNLTGIWNLYSFNWMIMENGPWTKWTHLKPLQRHLLPRTFQTSVFVKLTLGQGACTWIPSFLPTFVTIWSSSLDLSSFPCLFWHGGMNQEEWGRPRERCDRTVIFISIQSRVIVISPLYGWNISSPLIYVFISLKYYPKEPAGSYSYADYEVSIISLEKSRCSDSTSLKPLRLKTLKSMGW